MFGENVDQLFLIDFGLASKYMDNGKHRPFVMDQRRAHDGTLEFTSRDAHLGAHSRRSDLECLGYNLLFWSQGYLPWREAALQHNQEDVHRGKEYLMTDVRSILKTIYGEGIPKFIGEYLHMIGELGYKERPDYARYRRLFKTAFRRLQIKESFKNTMNLCRENIRRNCIRFEIENVKLFPNLALNNNNSNNNNNNNKMEIENDIMTNDNNNETNITDVSGKNLTNVNTPFQCRVSPKNLRSKSGKKKSDTKEQNYENILSWSERFSQNPDEIARYRAEQEFEREELLLAKSKMSGPKVRQYEGRPTYAILEMLHRRNMEVS